jgi:hypothetical protein
MEFAIDLSPRQSARTIEQATRKTAEIVVEPRVWPAERIFICRLHPRPVDCTIDKDLSLLTLMPRLDEPFCPSGDLEPNADLPWDELIGTYCDAAIRMDNQRYLIEADVIYVERISPRSGDVRIYMSQPEQVQVAQRRRFRRIHLAQSTPVKLYWYGQHQLARTAVAWLCNLSADGIACRADVKLTDDLWIGDELHASFSLGTDDAERYEMDAVLCNKVPAGSEGKVVLGMQFITDAQHAASAESAKTLRERLLKSYKQPASTGGSES